MKSFYALLILFFSFSIATAQVPPNDSCANAFPIGCDTTISGTTDAATMDGADAPTCGGEAQAVAGVWYSFMGTGDYVTVSTCNAATYDTRITVYSGTCGSFNCVAEDDDGANCADFTSKLGFNSVNGTQYYFLIHGYDGTGTFDLTVSCDSQCTNIPPNDSCSQAISLTLFADTLSCIPDTGTNVCASASLANFCDPYVFVQDVWYTFNTDTFPGVYVTMDELTGSNFYFAVYEMPCGGNPIFCSFPAPEIATAVPDLQPGTDYLLQVWNGGFDYEGSFTICLAGFIPPPPPSNDSCINPDTLGVNLTCVPTAGICASATEDYPADSCNGFLSFSANDVWYVFTATSTTITVEVDPAFDAVVQVLESCGGKPAGCSDEPDVVPETILLTNLVIGNTYYIRVFPFTYGPGSPPLNSTFDICLIGPPAAMDENETFRNVAVFPNPNEGQFQISGLEHGMNWQLNDLSGRILLNGNSSFIDVLSYSKGIYFLTVSDGTSARTFRVVVN